MNFALLSANGVVSAALIAALAGSPPPSAASELPVAQIVPPLFSRLTAGEPGASVAVLQGGSVVFAAGYGSADLRFGLPITPRTKFHVGSVTKQFTAFAVYKLAIEQKLALTDSVRRYVSELPAVTDRVTVQELLWQTSGIRDYIELAAMSGHQLGDSVTPKDLLALAARQTSLNFAPGTQYNYSNTNYALLAEIVRRVSGESFATYVEKSILLPLHMNDSLIQDAHTSVVAGLASSYWPTDVPGTYAEAFNGSDVVGDSGLVTTPSDLLLWERNLMTRAMGKDELTLMLRQGLLSNGTVARKGVGSGIDVDDYKGTQAIHFDGGTAGFRADVVAYPSRNLGIAIFTNLVSYFPDDELDAISDAMLFGKSPTPASAGTVPLQSGSSITTFPLAADALSAYDGEYRSAGLDTTYWVCRSGNGLVARHVFGPDVPLQPLAHDRFAGAFWWFQTASFSRDSSNAVASMSISGFRGARDVTFIRTRKGCN